MTSIPTCWTCRLCFWIIYCIMANHSIMANNHTCSSQVTSILTYFLTRGVEQELVVFDIINIFLSIPIAFLNALVVITILRKTSLKTSSNIFLLNLACSDLCFAVVALPFSSVMGRNAFYANCHATFCVFFLSTGLGAVSFLTIVASTVDSYLALKLHLRYSSQITTRLVTGVCVFIWLLGFGTAGLLLAFKEGVYVILVGAILCMLLIMFCYVKIFGFLQHHCNQIQAQINSLQGPTVENLTHVKKTISVIVCIIVWFMLSYTPHLCCSVIIFTKGRRASIEVIKLWLFSINIVCLNSLVNPVIYCWRMAEIRYAMKETLAIGFAKVRGFL